MAFVDIPDGSTWKALNLHKTYFNGRMINVEETKDGGKKSAVCFYLRFNKLTKQSKKDFIKRMRKLHNHRNLEQNVQFDNYQFNEQKRYIETYLKTKKANVLWSVDFFDLISY